jgi:hypothetical protein
MSRIDPYEPGNDELLALQAKVHYLPSQELDRDIAELSHEIAFLSDQVGVDIESYQMEELSHAYEKITYFKRKSEILQFEMIRRNAGIG